VRISEFDPPHRFTDEMVRGAFHRMRHVHELERTDEDTRMTDAFELGPLGWLADVLAVKPHDPLPRSARRDSEDSGGARETP
jgi:ligand-binding SRPBCC domain-containing protein